VPCFLLQLRDKLNEYRTENALLGRLAGDLKVRSR
jgi:hypothetical protein